MKIMLFLVVLVAGEPPQQEAVEVENIKVCYEQLGKLMSQPAPDGLVVQYGCAIVRPGTPA